MPGNLKKFLLFFFLFPIQNVAAGPLGLGLVIGLPTGITANYKYGVNQSVATAISWGDADTLFHLDHLWYRSEMVGRERLAMQVYMGIGLRIHQFNLERDRQLDRFGIRVPLGLSYMLNTIPGQIFGEIAPGLNLIRESSLIFDAGLGLRYYF